MHKHEGGWVGGWGNGLGKKGVVVAVLVMMAGSGVLFTGKHALHVRQELLALGGRKTHVWIH